MPREKLTWDQTPDYEEAFTDKDEKEIETGGSVPIGRYAATCESSEPQIEHPKDTSKPSLITVNLKWVIDRVIEVDHEPPTEEHELLVGRYLYDSVIMPYDNEPDWSIRRRKAIALYMGIIKPNERITNATWRDKAPGARAILTVVSNNYTNKNGEAITGSPKIDLFKGYAAIGSDEPVTKEDFSEI
jgi:hypothetical protein